MSDDQEFLDTLDISVEGNRYGFNEVDLDRLIALARKGAASKPEAGSSVLVPVVPTEAMREAGIAAIHADNEEDKIDPPWLVYGGTVAKCYRAMIAAAAPGAVVDDEMVGKVAKAIGLAIQFQKPFGEMRESNGDWVTTVGQINEMENIASIAARAAITAINGGK